MYTFLLPCWSLSKSCATFLHIISLITNGVGPSNPYSPGKWILKWIHPPIKDERLSMTVAHTRGQFSNLCVALTLGFAFVMFFSPSFSCDFLSTSKEIGWEEHLWYDLFSVEWDVYSINLLLIVWLLLLKIGEVFWLRCCYFFVFCRCWFQHSRSLCGWLCSRLQWVFQRP